jgi:N-carbamoylputrescine amidase
MTKLTVAALQLALHAEDEQDNIAAVSALVEQAAGQGAQIVLPPELFSGCYFCSVEDDALFALARPVGEHPSVLATLAMIGADGEIMGTYRKSHIPDGPGYEEKFYFRPGNDGFKVWDVFGARIGVGVCWDQWYPEAARVMALMGAEVLLYPTAIGSEPKDPEMDTSRLWRRAMIGHAVSNCMPVVAANRIGDEGGQHFYGHSFICDEWGDYLAEYGSEEAGVLVATLDLGLARKHRASWGFFRDRRPQLYGRICQDI